MKLFTYGRIPSTLSAYFIIIHHQLGLDRPVSASSNSLFKRLPSRLRPFGLPYFSIIFRILLLFTLVTCRCQFDFNFLSFSSTVSTSNSSKISSFLSWSKRVYPALLMKNFISTDLTLFLSSFLMVQISLRCNITGRASALYNFIPENSGIKVGSKALFTIPST